MEKIFRSARTGNNLKTLTNKMGSPTATCI